ncbi:MAG: hypothetical protein PUF12_02260 [Thermoflexaceae bacterium]|nr:hypothetical protein [Thermoflexaceae bacterium]
MKKILKIISKVAIFLLLLMIINKILIFILVDDADSQFRFSMHEFYNQENIDVLFLGSSHVFCGVNPAVLEEEWGKDVYLASTSVQKPDVSYYLLNEAVKQYDLETVYLDMYYWQYRDDPKQRTQYQMDYIYCVSDYMRPSWDKVMFLLDASSADFYLDSFFVPARYGDRILDPAYVEQVIKSKRSSAYQNYECPEELATTYYKGFISAGGGVQSGSLIYPAGSAALEPIREEPISEYSMKYLKKIIRLCRERGIELVLFTTPMTDYHTAVIGNYDAYHEAVRELAEEQGVAFYDFNLLREDYEDYADELFLDSHHLNGRGADVFSADLAQLMTRRQTEDISVYFYESVEEKHASTQEQCYGLLLGETQDGYEIIPIGNRSDLELEYRITQTDPETGKSIVIQEYSVNRLFQMQGEENASLTIEARVPGNKNNCNEAVINVN